MSKLFVKPKEAEDITRHLSLFSVGNEVAWVGHGQNMLYRPHSEIDFGADDESSAIVARTGFTTERPIVGRRIIIPESRLGQVGILSQSVDQDSLLTAAISIPFKAGWFGRTNEVVSYVPIPAHQLDPELLNQPSIFLHTAVRNAMFKLINTEPAQLTPLGE